MYSVTWPRETAGDTAGPGDTCIVLFQSTISLGGTIRTGLQNWALTPVICVTRQCATDSIATLQEIEKFKTKVLL